MSGELQYAGENELLVAVTEVFGGWEIMAEFADLQGIEIHNTQ